MSNEAVQAFREMLNVSEPLRKPTPRERAQSLGLRNLHNAFASTKSLNHNQNKLFSRIFSHKFYQTVGVYTTHHL